MKITIDNIGIFKHAEYELADLTIICGKNNTGKTYATYALFGFFDFFRRGFDIKVPLRDISTLLERGKLIIPIDVSQESIDRYIQNACESYQKLLPRIFSAQEKYFKDSSFSIEVDSSEIILPENFEYTYKTNKRDFLHIIKTEGKNELVVSLFLNATDDDKNIPLKISLSKVIGDCIKKIIFNNIFRECFIASAERTGAVIFKEELNFQKNTILREVATADEIHIEDIVDKIYNTNYALPVRRNIDFIRNLESISKDIGELNKENPNIIDFFNSIVGGEYKVSKDGVFYCPSKSKGAKLTIGESASSVRSLLDIYFYLKHVARAGHILIIDEPELNLHPESQRKLARLLALLVNHGIKVCITTHSDYIVKEFNTLLMLHARKDRKSILKIMNSYNYSEKELLSPSQIRVFISDKTRKKISNSKRKTMVQSLIPAKIDPDWGIELASFDNTIREMNSIQESIMFSSNESANY